MRESVRLKASGECPKCGGRDIRRYTPAEGIPLLDTKSVIKPKAWAIAYTCGACGFIEFWAEGEGYHPPPR